MKKILLVLSILFSITLYGQAPQAMNAFPYIYGAAGYKNNSVDSNVVNFFGVKQGGNGKMVATPSFVSPKAISIGNGNTTGTSSIAIGNSISVSDSSIGLGSSSAKHQMVLGNNTIDSSYIYGHTVIQNGLRLPTLINTTCLATDASGNVIAGSVGTIIGDTVNTFDSLILNLNYFHGNINSASIVTPDFDLIVNNQTDSFGCLGNVPISGLVKVDSATGQVLISGYIPDFGLLNGILSCDTTVDFPFKGFLFQMDSSIYIASRRSAIIINGYVNYRGVVILEDTSTVFVRGIDDIYLSINADSGLTSLHNFTPYYDSLSFVQKVYVDDKVHSGTAMLTFDGSTTTFYIPTGYLTTLSSLSVTAADKTYQPDTIADSGDGNIIITYTMAPITGSGTIYWQAFR